jgi:GTP-binding protein HflX
MTHSDVLADNLLFATLDPTSRRLDLASGRRIILTDTVGFIQNLPTELVEAFAATLEEVRQAHMLVIIVDGAHPDVEAQLITVFDTLAGMGCEQPSLLVINKIDRLRPAELRSLRLRLRDIAATSPLCVSALRGTGLRDLRNALDTLAAGAVPSAHAERRRRHLEVPASEPADVRAAG